MGQPSFEALAMVEWRMVTSMTFMGSASSVRVIRGVKFPHYIDWMQKSLQNPLSRKSGSWHVPLFRCRPDTDFPTSRFLVINVRLSFFIIQRKKKPKDIYNVISDADPRSIELRHPCHFFSPTRSSSALVRTWCYHCSVVPFDHGLDEWFLA